MLEKKEKIGVKCLSSLLNLMIEPNENLAIGNICRYKEFNEKIILFKAAAVMPNGVLQRSGKTTERQSCYGEAVYYLLRPRHSHIAPMI